MMWVVDYLGYLGYRLLLFLNKGRLSEEQIDDRLLTPLFVIDLWLVIFVFLPFASTYEDLWTIFGNENRMLPSVAVFLCIMIPQYFYFFHDERYKEIFSRIEMESPRKRKRRCYIVISAMLVITLIGGMTYADHF